MPAPTAELPRAAVTLPTAYADQIGRDPFRALYVQPAAVAAPPAPDPAAFPVGLAQPGSGLTGGGFAGGGTTTGGDATPSDPAAQPVNTTYKLVLGRVSGSAGDRTATFSIDGKQQVAKVGTKFGPTSEIILLSFQEGPKPGQWTTVLQVGDGDPFDVVTGTPVYVR